MTERSTPLLLRRMILAVAAMLMLAAAVAAYAPARALSDNDWTVLARSGATDWRGSTGEGTWQELQMDARIPERAQIRTGANGHAVVAHSLDRIEVQPNSTVVVTASTGANGTMEIYQDSGAATYSVEKRPAGTFSVRTPYVVAIVKGTKFSVEIGEAGTSVSVIEGRVSVQDRRSGAAVDVLPGQRVRAGARQPGLAVTGTAANAAPPAGTPAAKTALGGTAAPAAADSLSATTSGSAVSTTASTVGGTLEATGGVVEDATAAAGSAVSGVGEAVGGTAGTAVDAVGGTVTDLGETVGGTVSDLGGGGSGGGSGGGGSGGGSGSGGSGGGSGSGGSGGGSDGGSTGDNSADSGSADDSSTNDGGTADSSTDSSSGSSSSGSGSGGGLGGALGGLGAKARDTVGGLF